MMHKSANLNEEDRKMVAKWGITDAQLYEIALNIGLLTAANYANLLKMPPTDDAFAAGKEGAWDN